MNLLAPLGKLYGRLMGIRNSLYERGTFSSYELGARTISIGNLTTGGTGKTPLVALVAKILIDEGETVCILTRGYGRANPKSRILVSDGHAILTDAATGGDEPVELAMQLEGKSIIVADPDRTAAAKWARERFPVSAFILDDGFQHLRVRRDLDIVCIDATNPCGNGQVLPAGDLREPFAGLARADAIVITRSDLIPSAASLEERLRRRNTTAPIFLATTEIQGFVPLDRFLAGERTLQDSLESAFVFTGIGNADSFVQTLARAGTRVAGISVFRDHHRFDRKDISRVIGSAAELKSEALVTTAKDAVKLKGLEFDLPCWVAVARTRVDDLDPFRSLVRGE